MAAKYDITVRNELYKYERSLVGYPISPQRRRTKIKRLRLFLQSLSKNPMTYPMCDAKELGQLFSSSGKALFPNLRQTNYEDESGTQWRVSFFQISANMVKIHRLVQSIAVDESKKSRVIRLTETKFISIIKECVTDILKEEFDYGKTSYKAKPKGKGELNDWELFNIINGIISKMISDKQISADDGEMLMHYGLYNNECYGRTVGSSHR